MKNIKVILLVVIALSLGWYLLSPLLKNKTLDDASPISENTSSSVGTLQGVFKAGEHDVAGEALLVTMEGETTLRFENFDTVNGPNLHIYLASDLSAKDYIDLGAIRATTGNINYEVPEGIDTTKYNKVLVWCVPFSVLFSYAELQ
jgi:hypothetical protein